MLVSIREDNGHIGVFIPLEAKVLLRLQFYSYWVQVWRGANAQQRVTL